MSSLQCSLFFHIMGIFGIYRQLQVKERQDGGLESI
jgi:hypothetical protein